MTMREISGSPKIQESLHFGFTDTNKTRKVERDIKEQLKITGINIISLDMVFGYVVVTLPNPAIDFKAYESKRSEVVGMLLKVLEGVGK